MTTTSTTTKSDALRTVPLFQGMTDGAITAIADLAEPAEFAPGAVLVRQGDAGETLLVILDGRATVDVDGVVVGELGNGDFLGEISLIDGGSRTATVTAIGQIQALVVDRAGFERLMTEHRAVRLGLLMALTARLRKGSPARSN